MSGWPVVALSELCQFKPPKSEARAKLLPTDEVSFVPMSDLGIGERYVTPRGSGKLEALSGAYTYFADGDVLLAKITPCFENGKLGIARGLTNGIGFGSSEFIVIRPSARLLPEYLYYFLDQTTVRERGAAVMGGAVGHKRVPEQFVRDLGVPLPTLEEQRRIVAVLDKAFAAIATAIANNKRAIDNTRELVQMLAHSAFSEQDTTSTFVRLGDVCKILNGRAYAKNELLAQGKTPILRVGNFFTNPNWYHSDLILDEDKYAYDGDLLYAWSASFGPRIWDGGRVIYHYHIWKMCPDEERLDKRFLFHFLEWDKEQIKSSQGAGTTMVHVTKASMQDRRLPLPPLVQQRQIAHSLDEALSSVDEILKVQTGKLSALAQLKRVVLHHAFFGRLAEREWLAA